MAFDGFVTRGAVHELNQRLKTGKIHKIYQPHETDLVFSVRANGQSMSLLISANPTYPRIYITGRNYVNPVEPPMFCMLLRKHLEGGIIESITQVDHERIIWIDVKVRDDLGDIHTKRLIVEIMGRHSNIILVNPEKNMILDGINHVTPAISSYRQVLPGREYVSPPKQDKLNPLEVTREMFLSSIRLNEGKLDKQMVDRFTGTSPTIAKELIHLAGLPTEANLWNTFYSIMDRVRANDYRPAIATGEEKADFSIIPLTHLSDNITYFDDLNACLENYYDQKANRDTVRQKAHELIRFLSNEQQKNQKKMEYLFKDYEEANGADQFKLYGELLMAQLHLVKRGDKLARVVNYYDENQESLEVPLDPIKSPSENAQAYFKRYNKLKNSMDFIKEQLDKTREEIAYLDSVITQIENAGVQDIEDIRDELVEQGYLKDRNKKNKKKKKTPEIEHYTSSEGYTIFVGKNNKQNEYLTHQVAKPFDTWLHTKDIPGSHVVIKGKEFGEKTLQEAAILASYYSKAKHSSQVPVDYTLIKHVKKPSGAKPGFVIYENQKTIFVTPDEKVIERLKG